MKTIIGNVMPEETRMAILEDGRLRDFAVERNDDMHIVNHIYKGTIQNILPSLQAAFVNIGRHKNAFIYMGDMFPRAASKEEIQQMHLSIGQSVLVQVIKDEQGMKGPKVTTNVSLAGRYAVLMPTVDYIGVSKKSATKKNATACAASCRKSSLPAWASSSAPSPKACPGKNS